MAYRELFDDEIAAVIAKAAELDLSGFAGHCGAAAIAINRVLFDDRGTLVAGLNCAFERRDRLIGHVAVRVEHPRYGFLFWDADGMKNGEEIESWGMLDPDDDDYRRQAKSMGFAYTEKAAYTAAMFEFDTEEEVLKHFPGDVDAKVTQLQAALKALGLSVNAKPKP